MDRFATVRNQLGLVAEAVGEWAGIPMPIEGEKIHMAPSYSAGRLGEAFDNADLVSKEPDDEPDADFVNSWYSKRHGLNVVLWREDGKVQKGFVAPRNRLDMAIRTCGMAPVWGIAQEAEAVQTLGGLLRHHPFRSYMLTGMFLETSKRSGVTYLFRRLRPTLAISGRTGSLKVLAALCLHPIAYYENSSAGAMTPTDDIIAHLMMMRGDENLFWKRANQHQVDDVEAML